MSNLDIFSFKQIPLSFISISNKLCYFNFFVLLLFADDELLIERSIYKGKINPGEGKQSVEHKSFIATIKYTMRVRCDEHYYGMRCNNVCRPRDDYFGHYVCDHFGKRHCIEGWEGEDCKTGEQIQKNTDQKAIELQIKNILLNFGTQVSSMNNILTKINEKRTIFFTLTFLGFSCLPN